MPEDCKMNTVVIIYLCVLIALIVMGKYFPEIYEHLYYNDEI